MSKNYNQMYKSSNKVVEETPVEVVEPVIGDVIPDPDAEPVEEAPVEEVVPEVVEEVVEEKKPEPVKEEKKELGKVIGGASLNVRKNPVKGTNIIGSIAPGTVVKIEEEANEFYRISAPVEGFVMKKFIEV